MKIYNGYKLPLMSLTELNEFSKDFRKKAYDKAEELFCKWLGERIAEVIDDMMLLDEETFVHRYLWKEEDFQKSKLISDIKTDLNIDLQSEKIDLNLNLSKYPYDDVFYIVYEEYKRRYSKIQATMHRDPEVDFDCTVCYIPMEDKILALFYTEQNELIDLWESCPEVTLYSSETQKDLTEEETSKQRKDWYKALPGFTVPKDHGLIADFVKGHLNIYSIWREKDITDYVPSFDIRVRKCAVDATLEYKFTEIKNANSDEDPIRIVNKSEKWLRTDEGKALIEEKKIDFIPILIEKIKKEHLSLKLNVFKNEYKNY